MGLTIMIIMGSVELYVNQNLLGEFLTRQRKKQVCCLSIITNQIIYKTVYNDYLFIVYHLFVFSLYILHSRNGKPSVYILICLAQDIVYKQPCDISQ